MFFVSDSVYVLFCFDVSLLSFTEFIFLLVFYFMYFPVFSFAYQCIVERTLRKCSSAVDARKKASNQASCVAKAMIINRGEFFEVV